MSDPTIDPVVEPVDPAPAPAEPAAADPGTLADGNAKPDTPQVIPATWPDDWRSKLSGNEDDLKVLNRFKDPANIWKSYKSLRQKFDSGEVRSAMPDPSNEEAMKEWRTANGIPETPEGYREGLELELDEISEPIVNKYFEDMHAAGVTPEQAQKGLNSYFSALEAAQEQRAEQDKQFRAQAEDELRAEWGPEFRGNLNGLRNLLDTYGGEGLKEVLFTARQADGTMLGDNPEVLRFLVGLNRELNPHGTVVPAPGETQASTVNNEIAKIEAEMAKGRHGTYWSDEGMQSRYRDLLSMKERMA